MEQKKENRVYRAAVYVRLSKEDGDKEESDSIVNQKELIKSYLSGREDITACMECVDDGYSGADFDRPNFRRMMKEIEAGKIDCVIVKDLSRFGRNFVEAGRYIDQIFPALGIRFIAVNDGFDSINGRTSSDRILIPFKNLINDAYCRDISIKIRSQLEIKRKKGDFIGSFAVYGYFKDPADRHKLVVDSYAADVVRDIFKWKLEGASQQRIADRLNERGELSPMEYKRFCGLNYQSGFQINPKAKWTAVAIGRILRNEFYIGTLVQGKRTTPNHKVKKTIQKPSGEWVRVKTTMRQLLTGKIFMRWNACCCRICVSRQRKKPYTCFLVLYSVGTAIKIWYETVSAGMGKRMCIICAEIIGQTMPAQATASASLCWKIPCSMP